ncbi:MAG: pilus assembly protein PilM [Limisphaerales bacterium]
MADRDSLPAFPLKKFSLSREQRSKLPAQATALDIDGRSLRVVQTTTRGGQPAVSRVCVAPLNLPADTDRADAAVLGAAIAKALDQLKLKPGPVVMGIPRAQVVLKTLLLPVIADVRELASVVHLQVGRDLPFRVADAVIDFQVHRQITPPPPKPDANAKTGAEAPAAPLPKLEVLVAVAKRDVVAFYQRAAEAAGVKLIALGLLPSASARCVHACNVVESGQAYGLISLRPDEVGIDIVADGAVPFSRGASVKPPTEPGAAEAFISAATIEVVRSLHSYSGLGATGSLAKLFVVGATGHEAGVVAALATRVSAPVALLDADALDLPRDSLDAAAGATAGIGLALGFADAEGLPFDFLNPKRPAVQRDLRRIKILAGLATAAVLFLIVAGVRGWLVGRRQTVLDALTAEAVAAEKNRPAYRQMTGQAGVVNEWVRGERDWLLHYAYLTAVLPRSEEVFLTSLSVSGQGLIRLAVRAKSGAVLAKLEKQLRAAGYEVKPLAITPGSDRSGYEFLSTVELVVPAKLKIDLTKVSPPERPADDASLDPSVRRKGGG